MAIQAKSHAKWLIMINFLHFIYGAVALDATDSPIHMDGVIEVDEIRNSMDLHPGNRLSARRAVAHESQARIVLQNLIVAIHANTASGDV